jgi:hypothetical protein
VLDVPTTTAGHDRTPGTHTQSVDEHGASEGIEKRARHLDEMSLAPSGSGCRGKMIGGHLEAVLNRRIVQKKCYTHATQDHRHLVAKPVWVFCSKKISLPFCGIAANALVVQRWPRVRMCSLIADLPWQ